MSRRGLEPPQVALTAPKAAASTIPPPAQQTQNEFLGFKLHERELSSKSSLKVIIAKSGGDF
jgi:hypothetical protein